MKKYILILTFLLGSFSMAFAQDNLPGELTKQERIEALYVAYISRQLEFTPEEAQKFWPVYTQFKNDLKAIKPTLSELDKEQARLDIKRRYQDNFTKIIGVNRCERFFRMGDEFRKKLVDRMQKQENNPERPRQNQRRNK